jgi:hypothetical protein
MSAAAAAAAELSVDGRPKNKRKSVSKTATNLPPIFRNKPYENDDAKLRPEFARYRCAFCQAYQTCLTAALFRKDRKWAFRKTPEYISRDIVRRHLPICIGKKSLASICKTIDFVQLIYRQALPYLAECAKVYAEYCWSIETAKFENEQKFGQGRCYYDFAVEFTATWLDANLPQEWRSRRIYLQDDLKTNRPLTADDPSFAGLTADDLADLIDAKIYAIADAMLPAVVCRLIAEYATKPAETPEIVARYGIDFSELFTFLMNPWYGILNGLDEFNRFLATGTIVDGRNRPVNNSVRTESDGKRKAGEFAASAADQSVKRPKPEPKPVAASASAASAASK